LKTAEQFERNINHALHNEPFQDTRITNNFLFETYHWTYEEIQETPMTVIYSIFFQKRVTADYMKTEKEDGKENNGLHKEKAEETVYGDARKNG